MASKRHQRQVGCKGKKRYETSGAAFFAMKQIDNVVCPLNIYLCKCCGAWHVGRVHKNKFLPNQYKGKR